MNAANIPAAINPRKPLGRILAMKMGIPNWLLRAFGPWNAERSWGDWETKMKAHTNFDINLYAQNALIERSDAIEVNLYRIVLKQLEVFAQNRLGN